MNTSSSRPSAIDTHTHLTFDAFDYDLPDVLSRAQDNRINRIITVATDLESSHACIKLAEKYPILQATAGLHPTRFADYKDDLQSLAGKLDKLCRSSEIVAVGETGIDLYQRSRDEVFDPDNRYRSQLPLFHLHLNCALKHNLPVIIHVRDAWDELWHAFSAFRHLKKSRLTGVFHSWSGRMKDLEKVLELGFMVSFTGNVTYPNNTYMQEIASRVPADRLLLETDAPFMAPQNHRGTRCEPSYVIDIARFLAEFRSVSLDELLEITTANAHHLFGLS